MRLWALLLLLLPTVFSDLSRKRVIPGLRSNTVAAPAGALRVMQYGVLGGLEADALAKELTLTEDVQNTRLANELADLNQKRVGLEALPVDLQDRISTFERKQFAWNVRQRHTAFIKQHSPDILVLTERFLHAPYELSLQNIGLTAAAYQQQPGVVPNTFRDHGYGIYFNAAKLTLRAQGSLSHAESPRVFLWAVFNTSLAEREFLVVASYTLPAQEVEMNAGQAAQSHLLEAQSFIDEHGHHRNVIVAGDFRVLPSSSVFPLHQVTLGADIKEPHQVVNGPQLTSRTTAKSSTTLSTEPQGPRMDFTFLKNKPKPVAAQVADALPSLKGRAGKPAVPAPVDEQLPSNGAPAAPRLGPGLQSNADLPTNAAGPALSLSEEEEQGAPLSSLHAFDNDAAFDFPVELAV